MGSSRVDCAEPVVFSHKETKCLVMSVTRDGDESKEMTLGFELSAFKEFARPNDVIADARAWSRYVGLVANDTDAVTTYVNEHGLQQDFDLEDADKWLALERIREGTDTDRYVFVGLTPDDQLAAEQTGWEFVTVHEVAEKAGWVLEEQAKQEAGILNQLRTRLQSNPLWPFRENN